MARDSSLSTNFRVGYVYFPPYVVIDSRNGSSVLSGIFYQLILDIAYKMNLNLTFIREPSDNFGTWINNTWDGVIGMLYRNEIDIVLNPLRPKADMMEFVRFTSAISFGGTTLLSGKETLNAGHFKFFKVLDGTVWIAILTTAFAIVALSTIIKKGPQCSKSHTSTKNAVYKHTWLLLSLILRQNAGDKVTQRGRDPRVQSLFLPLSTLVWQMGVAFVVMQTFQSLLVSTMAVRKSYPLVDSIADLQKRALPVPVAPVELAGVQDTLVNTGLPTYDAAYEIISRNLWPGKKILSDDTFQKVQEGKLSIYHGHIALKNFIKKWFEKTSRCNLHLSKHIVGLFPLVLPVQRKMPRKFFEEFNSRFTRLMDSEVYGRHLKRVVEVSRLCTSYQEQTLSPLRIDNIIGVLLIWTLGVVAGCIVLIYEVFYQKKRMTAHKK